ncbi:MAG TPA: efflux transporter outer membrane subunit [Rhodocyclaceae bacterium]|nr:efflux transporter outer membrane subunit [Rhodocyclaceae bacterium]
MLVPKSVTKYFAGMLLLLSAGCANMGSISPQSQLVQGAQVGIVDQAADRTPLPAGWPAKDWWLIFSDPQLNHLIDTAIAGSPDMRLAEARVRMALQAEAIARGGKGADIALNGNATREKFSKTYIYPPPLGGSMITDARLAIDFTYDFDFWHKHDDVIASAANQSKASQAQAESSKLILSVAVASTYGSLQRSFAELAFAQQRLTTQQQIVALLRTAAERGIEAKSAIEPSAATEADMQQEIAAIQQQIDLMRHQLAALAGLAPNALNDLSPQLLSLPAAMSLPRTLPADFLGRRPDIVAQRYLVESATQDIAAAKADFYPNVNLAAFVGLQSLGLSQLLQAGSTTFGVGPALHLPLFNAGTLRARLGARYASYDAAVESYNQTVIDAVRDVADQTSRLNSFGIQLKAAADNTTSLQRSADASAERYRRGIASHLDVLDAQQSLLEQKQSTLALQDAQLQASLGLIKALGGGYVGPADMQTSGN